MLTLLDLSDLLIPRLPWVLSQLTWLRQLHIHGWRDLSADAEAWRPLEGHPGLRSLQASCCNGLGAVPAALGTLRSLEVLQLWGSSNLHGGWHYLASLPRLSRLRLRYCGLGGVPPPELAPLAKAGILEL